jgi:nucleotide-binding universal stress UspA family protein
MKEGPVTNPLIDSEPTRAPRALDCRTVLVPLDGSAAAERALPTAVWLAERLGARLDVVAADVHRDELWWYQRYADELRQRHPAVGDVHVEQVGGVAGTLARVAASAGPTIVCMATQGRGRTAAFLGSTFADVTAAGDWPVLAVGPHVRQAPAAASGGRLVACLDGSEDAARIVPEAAAWARALGLGLTILTIAEPAARPWLPPAIRVRGFGPPDPEQYIEALAAGPELTGLDVDTVVVWDYVGPDAGVFGYLEAHPRRCWRSVPRPAGRRPCPARQRGGPDHPRQPRPGPGPPGARAVKEDPMAVVMTPTTQHPGHLAHVRERLHALYDEACGTEEVDRAIDQAAHRLADAPVDAFVPLLVERAARAHLTAASRTASPADA